MNDVAGTTVRKMRLQRGWSQERLAELVGVSTRTIQRIERGGNAGLETVNALAAVFETDRSTLLDEETTMDNETTAASADEREAIRYVRQLKEFYSHLAMYVVFVVAFAVFRGPTDTATLWMAGGWGIGVLLHGLVAHEWFNLFGPEWEKRQVEKRLGRKL